MKKYIKEPFAALSHLLGAVLSVFGLLSLLEVSGSSERVVVAVAVYGASLILLFIASALTHGLHCSPETVERLERFDHAAIFLLIAGTYTPICLLVIRGPTGWILLGLEWSLACIGIYSLYARTALSKFQRASIYLAMGWLFIFALSPIYSAVPSHLFIWLLAGAGIYTVGSVVFVTNRPVLWPGIFDAHDLWHVFVLAGSSSHFVFVSSYIRGLSV